MSLGFYFHERLSNGPGQPAGYTVSRSRTLPPDEFLITVWQNPKGMGSTTVTLWFVDGDNFSAGEREQAMHAFCKNQRVKNILNPKRKR